MEKVQGVNTSTLHQFYHIQMSLAHLVCDPKVFLFTSCTVIQNCPNVHGHSISPAPGTDTVL